MLEAEIDYERNVANEAVKAKESIEADLSAKLDAAISTVESLEQTVQELTSALDTKVHIRWCDWLFEVVVGCRPNHLWRRLQSVRS